MTLKRKITAEEFEKLNKVLQDEYTEDGDEFILDAESDTKAADKLQRAHDREKKKAKDLAAELKAAKDKLAELEDDDGEPDPTDKDKDKNARGSKRKQKDIETLTQAHKDKITEIEAAAQEKLDKKNNVIKEQMISSAASEMATAISTKPKYILRDIRDRLDVEFDDDGEPTLIIKTTKGKPSDLTLEQLRKEFVANKEYADIMIGSKASGASGARKGPEPKPSSAGASETPPLLSKLTGKALVEHLKAMKENSDA